jgi:hypothetical protein
VNEEDEVMERGSVRIRAAAAKYEERPIPMAAYRKLVEDLKKMVADMPKEDANFLWAEVWAEPLFRLSPDAYPSKAGKQK